MLKTTSIKPGIPPVVSACKMRILVCLVYVLQLFKTYLFLPQTSFSSKQGGVGILGLAVLAIFQTMKIGWIKIC